MDIARCRNKISRLRQERGLLEQNCENPGRLLPASFICRYRLPGEKAFKSIKDQEGKKEGRKVYGYITYLKDGVTRHKYIRKKEMEKVSVLCARYQKWWKRLARIREINEEILRILEEIGDSKKEEVKSNVRKRSNATGDGQAKRTKPGRKK